MPDFVSEDDLDTFEGWMRYQAVDVATLAPHDLKMWRDHFNEIEEKCTASSKVGLMKLRPPANIATP